MVNRKVNRKAWSIERSKGRLGQGLIFPLTFQNVLWYHTKANA